MRLVVAAIAFAIRVALFVLSLWRLSNAPLPGPRGVGLGVLRGRAGTAGRLTAVTCASHCDGGTVTVIVARFSAAVDPVRLAQPAGERIQAGMPGGRSSSGMSALSVGAKLSP